MTNEIKQLKDEEQTAATAETLPADQSSRPNIFGPLVIILIGAYFLFNNLGWVDFELYWGAALSLWPLALIVAGINILADQMPQRLGTLIRTLNNTAALVIFGGLLLMGPQFPILGGWMQADTQGQHAEIQVPRDGIDTAVVEIDFDSEPSTITALNDSRNFMEASIDYRGDLEFRDEVNDGRADIYLNSRFSGFGFNMGNTNPTAEWNIRLGTGIPTELVLDSGSGSGDYDLSALTLQSLDLDSGSGAIDMRLPDGDYTVRIDTGSGRMNVVLPANGRQTITEWDSGSGAIRLELPAGQEARLEVEDGSGTFTPGQRLQLVSGERDDDGVWETAGYGPNATDAIDINIDIGSGAVTVIDR